MDDPDDISEVEAIKLPNANTVLVTGAMGQLGRRITALLLSRGRTVVALDLRTDATVAAAEALRPGPGHPGSLVPAYVDLLDAHAVQDLVVEHQPGRIVHLAAVVAPTCYRNPTLARRVNVAGTVNLVEAAKALTETPTFIEASSAGVYGSRNPYRHSDRLTADTPVNPVDCYGEDKVAAEKVVAASGLPHATLRLGGIISTDTLSMGGPDYLVLMRATPRDNRVHAVDVRDAALAFANAADLGPAIDGKVLLIGGDDSYVLRQRQLEDDMLKAMGVGRLGPSASLPGDPDDDRGWGLTDWFDTNESQRLLDYQEHHWDETLAWVAQALGPRRTLVRALSPVVRPLMRGLLAAQRRKERRGPYANPWKLAGDKYGAVVLAPTDW